MATFYIQLENKLLQISGDLTAANISKALGYVPVSPNVTNELSQRVDNITFDSLKDNPFLQDGSGELNIVDESGNIIAKVNAEGIRSVDFITGEHRLSNKTDKTYVDEAIKNVEVDLTGYATEEWVENKNYLTEHQDISHLATKNEIPSIDNLATKDEVSNIDFYNIKDNPIVNNGDGKLLFVDENGYIGLQLEEDGLYVKDVIADGHTLSQKADKSELPTKTSDLTNDSGFITINDVPVLEIPEEYVTETELSQKGFLTGEEASEELDDIETNTYLKYVPQTLTEEQKEQARKNIGIDGVSSMNYDLNVKAVNHRGYSYEAPENTIPAYIMSKQKGFTYVEADVAFTKDNVSVLLHDLTIDRTSDGSGKIKDLTYEQVLQYDFGSWKSQAYKGVKIASFKEFIVLCKQLGLHPYIELKSSDNYTQEQITQIVKEVNACGMNGKVTYISFYAKYLRYVKEVDQISRLGFVVTSISSGTIDAAIELKTGKNEVFIDASLKNLTDDGVQLCIENGIPLEVWTVNKETDIINMSSYICGVTSDELIAGKVLYNQGLNYVPPISNYVPTESITLSQSSLSFNNRESQTIEAILEPSNASSKVEWSTSDSNIAMVENGLVTPTNDGTCTITAISDDKSASCEVNVDFIKYSITSQLLGCSLNNTLDKVVIGDSYTTEITPDNGYSLKNGEVSVMMGGIDITSSSYNNGVITIDNVNGDIIINASAAEFDGLLVDLDLVNVGEDGVVRNLGAGGSTYNTVVSKPKTNDSFSASSSGLTLGNHAYVNVPYEFKPTDSFSIICKGRIKTDSSNPYQRLFRTNNDAPSWFIKGTTTPTIKLAGSVGSIEILNDLATKVSANNAIYIGSMDRNQMNEITVTCDGSIIKCYYNGVLMATQPSTSMKASTTIGIGDNDSSKSYYATEIEVERFAIYNRCLTMES